MKAKKRKPSPYDWVCPDCGSDQVQDQMWVLLNTDEILNSCDSYRWCSNCDNEGDDGEKKYLTQRKDYEASV